MMEKTTKAQSSVHWNQIRVNLPEDFYTLLRQRAASHHRSLSAEALQLMRVGLAHVKPQENIAGEVKNLDRYVRLHLEPLVFIAAMDAAFNAENWRQQAWMLHEHQYGEDKEKATAPYQKYQQMLRERATQRLQRKLRDSDLSTRDDDSEEDQ